MPSTPSSSPSSSRAAARQQERSNRTLGSPENRRVPAGPSAPSTSIISASSNQNLPREPVVFNGQEYHHLPPDLTTRLLSLSQSSTPSHHHQQNIHASNSAFNLAPAINITSTRDPASSSRQTLTPAQLAARIAALPPLNPQYRFAVSFNFFSFFTLLLTKL
jgi:hypothetical protein